AVLAKAAELNHEYTRIHDFVRSSVHTDWYAGAMRGAAGTLRDLRGNDVDQALLLAALLRASGAPTRLVSGSLEVPLDQLASQLGVSDTRVGA
ncbi:transglutaminase domain-containing protein, partial [Klebsiella pneumoniae]|uniref:transglutaminase domain-containing protein n=1 Tax=Klebsiella pneumoniae TaxID=573 RepID=UPI00200E6264